MHLLPYGNCALLVPSDGCAQEYALALDKMMQNSATRVLSPSYHPHCPLRIRTVALILCSSTALTYP